jgi:hypothetical protein
MRPLMRFIDEYMEYKSMLDMGLTLDGVDMTLREFEMIKVVEAAIQKVRRHNEKKANNV